MTDDYEYIGLMAEAWDLLRGDTPTWPDQDFYRAIIIEPRGGAGRPWTSAAELVVSCSIVSPSG